MSIWIKIRNGCIGLGLLTGTACSQAQPTSPQNSTPTNKKELITNTPQQDIRNIPNLGEMLTQDSITNSQFLTTPWEISWNRETVDIKDPIGAISPNGVYSGLMQSNYFNATNQIHLGLILGGKYKKFALKFYNTNRSGFNDALKAFQQAYEEKGITAFVMNSPERQKLVSYIKGNDTLIKTRLGVVNKEFNKIVQREGQGEDKELFKDLQIRSSNIIFMNYPGILTAITNGCKKINVNPMDINPAIWGMWIEHIVAKGNSSIIPRTLDLAIKKGGLQYINSEQYIDDFSTFKYTDKKGKIQKTICSNKKLIKEYLKAHNSLRTPNNLAGHTASTRANIHTILHPQEKFRELIALNNNENSDQPPAKTNHPPRSIEDVRKKLPQSQTQKTSDIPGQNYSPNKDIQTTNIKSTPNIMAYRER